MHFRQSTVNIQSKSVHILQGYSTYVLYMHFKNFKDNDDFITLQITLDLLPVLYVVGTFEDKSLIVNLIFYNQGTRLFVCYLCLCLSLHILELSKNLLYMQYTLSEKFWRISRYWTNDAIAKLYVT